MSRRSVISVLSLARVRVSTVVGVILLGAIAVETVVVMNLEPKAPPSEPAGQPGILAQTDTVVIDSDTTSGERAGLLSANYPSDPDVASSTTALLVLAGSLPEESFPTEPYDPPTVVPTPGPGTSAGPGEGSASPDGLATIGPRVPGQGSSGQGGASPVRSSSVSVVTAATGLTDTSIGPGGEMASTNTPTTDTPTLDTLTSNTLTTTNTSTSTLSKRRTVTLRTVPVPLPPTTLAPTSTGATELAPGGSTGSTTSTLIPIDDVPVTIPESIPPQVKTSSGTFGFTTTTTPQADTETSPTVPTNAGLPFPTAVTTATANSASIAAPPSTPDGSAA